MENLTSFLSSLIRMSTPLLIAGLGLVFSANAGIVNIGTEGFMLLGALMGCAGSYWTGSALCGALIAMAATMVFSAVFAFFTLNMRADQTVVGAAINIFASGLTITLNRIIFDTTGGVPVIATYGPMPIPGLSSLPAVGVLFNQSVVCYLAFLAVPVVWYIMKKPMWDWRSAPLAKIPGPAIPWASTCSGPAGGRYCCRGCSPAWRAPTCPWDS